MCRWAGKRLGEPDRSRNGELGAVATPEIGTWSEPGPDFLVLANETCPDEAQRRVLRARGLTRCVRSTTGTRRPGIDFAALQPLAVIGHLSRDIVAGTAPRIGGAPWYAGRALHKLGQDAVLFAKCGAEDRARFQRRLATLGLPASLATGGETTSFSLSYDADGHRTMTVEAIGEPWRTDEPQSMLLRRVEWLHVAPLLRSDFDAAALERLGLGRKLMLDAQGLVRAPKLGPLQLDANYDPDLLRHVSILKVAEEEARVLVGDASPEALAELVIPEIVLTLGSAGCVVIVRGQAEHVPARPVKGGADPTGAGDAFGAAYVAARAEGHAPASAARRATALVAALMMGG